MKNFFLTTALLLAGFALNGWTQESQPTTPVAKKPAEVAPAINPTAAPKPEPKPAAPKQYVIKSGDNPWLIAKNHGVSLEELLKVNEIKDPKNLKIGDVLLLPEDATSKNGSKQVSKQAPATTKGPQSGEGWETYTIQSGDNPWTIAKKLKVDHQKILTLNEGLNFRDLKIGQQIKVPKKS